MIIKGEGGGRQGRQAPGAEDARRLPHPGDHAQRRARPGWQGAEVALGQRHAVPHRRCQGERGRQVRALLLRGEDR